MKLEAKNYFDLIVRPTYQEYENEPWSFRRAMLAIVTTAHMVDYWVMAGYNAPATRVKMGEAIKSGRALLYHEHPELEKINDVADALKHGRLAELQNRCRDLQNVEQLRMSKSFFTAPFGQGVFAEAIDVYLKMGGEVRFSARANLRDAIAFWTQKLADVAAEDGL